MKKVLIGCLMLASVACYAQDTKKKSSLFGSGPKLFKSTPNLDYSNNDADGNASLPKLTFTKAIDAQVNTPEYYLQRASKDFIVSGSLGLGGAAIGCSAIAIKKKEAQYAMIGVGGLCGVIGIVYFFKGAVNIGKAGKTLAPANEGIGLNLNF